MIPNPILKVLSTMSCHEVRHLLIGGQACVLYGAAEFSRDCDIVISIDEANLARLSLALTELQATCIAVPEFRSDYLQRGHAVHFRCHAPSVAELRIDVMSKMRGCEPFDILWDRRTTIEDSEADECFEVISIEDLVKAKKTQRDKDWPMIRRLVEAHYDEFQNEPTCEKIKFWLKESRTVEMIEELFARFPGEIPQAAVSRPWLGEIDGKNIQQIQDSLKTEELAEKLADEAYWLPLKRELAELRLNRERRTRG